MQISLHFNMVLRGIPDVLRHRGEFLEMSE